MYLVQTHRKNYFFMQPWISTPSLEALPWSSSLHPYKTEIYFFCFLHVYWKIKFWELFVRDNLYASSGRVFKVNTVLQKIQMFWFKILRRLTIPMALMKLRAKASVEVMLWNALWIRMMPNLSHCIAGESGPRDKSWTCASGGDSWQFENIWHTEMSVRLSS